jgi:hypothetical protein
METFNCFPISESVLLLPLNENDEVLEVTLSSRIFASALMISSVIPSEKYSASLLELMFTKGSTAMDLLISELTEVV